MDKPKKMGRPREHDREQIAIDIIKWAEKDDSINVNKFCALYEPKFSTKKLSEWSKEDENFRESYDIAKAFLAFRREEWLNEDKLHVKSYDITAAAYDYIVREEKRSQAEFEAKIKSPQDNQVNEEDRSLLESLLSQLSSLQSARNKAEINNKTDCKS